MSRYPSGPSTQGNFWWSKLNMNIFDHLAHFWVTLHTCPYLDSTIQCYYKIVISTEHYRLRNYTYTLYILSTYKVIHRESCSLDFQYNSSCKKEHKYYFPSAQSTYKAEAVPHCCIVYWIIKGFNMTMNANPSSTK